MCHITEGENISIDMYGKLHDVEQSSTPTHIYTLITSLLPSKEEYLPECIRSVFEQRVPDGWRIQWIIMLDGGDESDRSNVAQLCQSEGLSPDVLVQIGVLSRNRGIPICRNLALASAEGKYVRAIDGDDILPEGAVERDIQVLEDHLEIGWCTSATFNLLADGELDGWLDPPEGYVKRGQMGIWWRGLGDRGEHEEEQALPIHPLTLCVRTNLLRILGGWLGVAPGSEENGLIIALNELCEGWFTEEIGLHYRVWNNSYTTHDEFDTSEAATAAQTVEQRLIALQDPQMLRYLCNSHE